MSWRQAEEGGGILAGVAACYEGDSLSSACLKHGRLLSPSVEL